MKKKLLIFAAIVVVLVSIACLSISAAEIVASGICGADGDNLTWTLDDAGTLTISGEGDMADFTYPSYTNYAPWYNYKNSIENVIIKYGVTSIGCNSFYNHYSLKTVIIPEGVCGIGDYAFSSCEKLTEIKLPNGLQTIGNRAFDACISILSVNIPQSVNSIGDYPFVDCVKLTSISVDENNKNYSSDEGVLYNKDKTILIRYPTGKSGLKFIVPNGVVTIAKQAFGSAGVDINTWEAVNGYCELTSIILPESLKKIEAAAFSLCHDLEFINLPKGLTSIESGTFRGCFNLQSVTIPNSVTSIGEMAFFTCKSMKKIYIPNSVTSIGDWAFDYCSSLTNVIIGNGVKTIGEYVFFRCPSLTNVSIGSGVTSIGGYAFSGCTLLTSIKYFNDEAAWNKINKGEAWDYVAGKDTAKGTYELIFNCDVISEQLTNLGASIRPETDEHSAGLRFGASFNKADFGIEGTYAYEGADVTFGMLLIPTHVLKSAGYDNVKDYFENCEGQKTLDIPAKKIFSQDETTVTYTAVLLGIPEESYTSEICALPYVIMDGEYHFGDEMRASFYDIAYIARTTTYSDEAIAAIVDEKKKAEAQAMAVQLDKIIAVVNKNDGDTIIKWPEIWS